MWIARALGTLVLGGAVYIWSTSLAREFKRRRREASGPPMHKSKELKDEYLALLPEAVRRNITPAGSTKCIAFSSCGPS